MRRYPPLPTEAPADERPNVYAPSRDESVHQAAAAALALAAARGEAVGFELHRTRGEARPGETPGAVALRWYERRRVDAVDRSAATPPCRVGRLRGPISSARPAPRGGAT